MAVWPSSTIQCLNGSRTGCLRMLVQVVHRTRAFDWGDKSGWNADPHSACQAKNPGVGVSTWRKECLFLIHTDSAAVLQEGNSERLEGWGQIIEDISVYLEMDGFDGSGDYGYDLWPDSGIKPRHLSMLGSLFFWYKRNPYLSKIILAWYFSKANFNTDLLYSNIKSAWFNFISQSWKVNLSHDSKAFCSVAPL